jgi:hypothetical protein
MIIGLLINLIMEHNYFLREAQAQARKERKERMETLWAFGILFATLIACALVIVIAANNPDLLIKTTK